MRTDKNALVLESVPYKERDAIVSYLCEDGLIRVLARGVQKDTSKNRRVTQPFSRVLITLNEKNNRFPTLMYGSAIQYYYRIQHDLVVQGVCFVLNDLIKRTRSNSSLFHYLESCWKAFQQGEENYVWACLVLREIIKEEGIQPQIDGCVHCGRPDQIETVSLQEGGLLCRRCNHGRYPQQSKNELIRMISLFRVKEADIVRFSSYSHCTVDDFLYWTRWIEYHLNLHLKSVQFLKSIR